MPGRRLRKATWSLVIVAINLPWLIPALVHASAPPAGTDSFAIRAEGPWGTVLTALGLGGIWNGDAVLPSRSLWIAPVVGLAVCALAALGWMAFLGQCGRIAGIWLSVSLVGCGVALLSAMGPALFVSLTALPGGGLLRDAHKWLAPLAMLIAVLAGIGIGRIVQRVSDRVVAVALVVLMVVIPVATMPDLALGASGRVSAVEYPDDFGAVRKQVGGGTGDVISLPWSTFRNFAWNQRRTVLDPMPRFLERSVVTDDTLLVARDGLVQSVSGDDPRSAEVGARLAVGERLSAFGPIMGIEYAVLAHDVAGPDPTAALNGAELVWKGTELSLYRLGDPAQAPPSSNLGLIVLCDLLVIALLLVLAVLRSFPKIVGRSARVPMSARRRL